MNPLASEPTTVFVAHQDPLLRAGLVAALRAHASFLILDDDAALTVSDRAPIDVVVADYHQALQLADTRTGGAAERPLAAARLLVVTSNDREADIRRAVEAGIHGYLLLGGSLSELVDGVTVVARGARYLSRAVAQRMADSMSRTSLTTREAEVLRLVTGGEPNKAIARRLHIEVGTVKSHVSAIMAKLGVSSRTQAAGVAMARGLVDEPAARTATDRPLPRQAPSAPASQPA